MVIYYGSDYKCHVENDGTLTAANVEFFDGKCKAFVEGYRYLPSGQMWTRPDGEAFTGEMIWPWRDYVLLEEFQRQYEEMLAQQADMAAALAVLGVDEEGEV